MSDITKCADKGCPSRKHCLRWTVPAGDHQSFADFDRQDAEECEAYIPVLSGRNERNSTAAASQAAPGKRPSGD